MGTCTTTEINPTLVKAFIKSTQNVISTMMGVESKIGKPELKKNSSPSYDVSGIVGFTGDINGSVVVSFHEETAVGLVEAFCCEKLDVRSDDFADAIGELCNMIAGNAKKNFGLNAGIGIPSVIVGTDHSVARLRDVPCILIPCSCEIGKFAVEINIKQVVGGN